MDRSDDSAGHRWSGPQEHVVRRWQCGTRERVSGTRMLDASMPPSTGEVDFRAVVERLPHIVWIVGVDGVTEYLNSRGTDYPARPRSSGVGAGLAGVDSSGRPRGGGARVGSARSGCPGRSISSSGCGASTVSTAGTSSESNPICDALGGVVRWVGTATDINDVKMSEARSADRRAHGCRNVGVARNHPVESAGRIRVRRPRVPTSTDQRGVGGVQWLDGRGTDRPTHPGALTAALVAGGAGVPTGARRR